MGVDFRCEECGGVVRTEAGAASRLKCPHCGRKVRVPAGLASLPRPQVPPDAPAAPAPAGNPEDEAAMGVMARLMPWVISAFFHLGVLVILAFVTIVVLAPEPPTTSAGLVPDVGVSPPAERPLPEKDKERDRAKDHEQEKERESRRQLMRRRMLARDDKIRTDLLNEASRKLQVPDLNTFRGERADLRLRTGPLSAELYGVKATGGDDANEPGRKGTPGGRRKPPPGGDVYHVVYVMDASGSMLGTFDSVRAEIMRSVCRLQEVQDFHVIFFNEKFFESPPRRLVEATEYAKREAVGFLGGIRPKGRTRVIPALRRAFEVLSRTPAKAGGKVIYLLTDGEFSDNEKVLRALKAMNADGNVRIHCILHRHRSPAAVKVLRRIAKAHGGEFKFVDAE